MDRKRHYVLASRKLPFGRKSLEGSEIAEADTRVSWRVVNGVVEDVTDVHRRVNLVSVVALARPTNAFFFVTTIYIESFVKARPTALVAGRSSDLSAKIPTRKKWCPHAPALSGGIVRRTSREESIQRIFSFSRKTRLMQARGSQALHGIRKCQRVTIVRGRRAATQLAVQKTSGVRFLSVPVSRVQIDNEKCVKY